MSFWIPGRKTDGRRNLYSITIIIPALIFFGTLVALFALSLLSWLGL